MTFIKIKALYKIFQENPSISIDSRKINKGDIFFALKGERFDGNQYAEQSIQKGASYVVIDDPQYNKGSQFLLVEDVLNSLQKLAHYHREQIDIPVLAITGSNGKTTTKELISNVLKSHYATHFTKGNFNNHIGVPLTLLQLPTDVDIAVIEMGANHIGEIADLCEIAAPTHGLITNIGRAHLEGFGGLEGVKKGKSELYKYLAKNKGIVFINMNENFLRNLAIENKRKVYYTKSEQPHAENIPYEVKLISNEPFIKVSFLSERQQPIIAGSQLMGIYNFNNIMTAIVIGRYFKVPATKIREAIENYVPSNNRSQLIKRNTNTFIMDAYNANPDSMKNALENFANLVAPSKIAILGDMLELGDFSKQAHSEILAQANELKFSKVILVGNEFKKVSTDNLIFENVVELKNWFQNQAFENTHILLKASRGIKLENLISN